jgi:hypothetical protein
MPPLARTTSILIAAGLMTAGLVTAELSVRPQAPVERADFKRDVVPFLETHCLECHSGAEPEDDLDLEPFLKESFARSEREEWRRIRELVQTRKMPPGGQARPPRQHRKMVTAWVDQAFGPAKGGAGQPPRPVLRRLNHSEYCNTVNDLLAVDFDAPRLFPAENVGFGFDNIGAALSMPDTLFEKYLDAAEQISQMAVITDGLYPPKEQAFDATTMQGNARGDYIWLYTNGDATAKWNSLRPGRYLMKVEAWGQQAGPDPCRMELVVDGRKLRLVDVPQEQAEPGVFEVELQIERGRYSKGVGTHTAIARFVNDFYKPDNPDPKRRDRNLAVVGIEIHGPLDARPPTEFQARLQSEFGKDFKAMASHLASQFWRRPAAKAEVGRLVKLLDKDLAWEFNVQTLLQALLVSPQFLYRPEQDGALTSWQMATRLSYFLRSTTPDAELLELAANDQLQIDDVLIAQVTRLLADDSDEHPTKDRADESSDALAQNFASQWLKLRLLNEVGIDAELFPTVTPALRDSMRRESLQLFTTVLRENLPIRNMLTADFTYLDPALAKHYGLPFDREKGKGIQRVDLSQSNRRGILSHASVLTLTSNPTRTSPVKRGKWVMETLLGTSPPPPPPTAGGLDESKVDSAASLRVQFEQHRSKPECISCHLVMDPIGFGLENYNAVGIWREYEASVEAEAGGVTIDNLGVLPDGRQFRGPLELSQMLYEDFSIIENALEQLYIYALGRGLSDDDYPILDSILDNLESGADATWRDLAVGIVLSDAFRKNSTGPPPPAKSKPSTEQSK